MTYEERIAAAQAKMDELKAKMAAAAEKSKAARELKKEEIATAIELVSDEVAETAGKTICYDYIVRCKEKNPNDYLSTLSLFDLNYTDQLVEQFNKALSAPVNLTSAKEKKYSGIINAIRDCERFGGDTLDNGCSNMLDMVDFIYSLDAAVYGITGELIDVIRDHFVVYHANCARRDNYGVSFYFPYIYSLTEPEKYFELNINENYNNILKKIYTDIPETTVEFSDRGSVTENGAFTVAFTPESSKYLSSVDYILMTKDKKGQRMVICSDNDIHKDWENLVFTSNFRGVTLAMNGHRLFYKTITSNSHFITFSAPLVVNGTTKDYRFSFIWNTEEFNSGHYLPGGSRGGYDENGLPALDVYDLNEGDKIQVTAGVIEDKNGELRTVLGGKFVMGKDSEVIRELPLDEKEYLYYFEATDIFGNQIASDTATFEMTKSYDELLNNPLPDGEYAAKVTKFEKYKPSKEE